MILSPLLLLPLLASPACAEPAEERAPYVAHLEDAEASDRDGLRKSLASVQGVARVEIDEYGRIMLHAKEDSFVARAHVEKALGSLELAVFDEPKWSKVMVYVVEAAGGG